MNIDTDRARESDKETKGKTRKEVREMTGKTFNYV